MKDLKIDTNGQDLMKSMKKREVGMGKVVACAFVLSILVLVFAGVMPVVAATAWTVDDSGGADFTTIQAAVDAASPRDTVIVYPGTYIENVDVNKDHLTVKSKSGTETTIVQAAYPDDNAPVFEVTADCVKISGFTVKGGAWPTEEGICYFNYGISLHDANYCKIFGNDLLNNLVDVALHFSNSNTIRNNNILNYGHGIYLWESSNNRIINNNIKGLTHSWSGIDVYYSDNNLIIGNEVSDHKFSGIEIALASGNNIYLNNFINNTGSYSEPLNTWNSYEEIAYTHNGNTYTNYLGNYWDDYTGSDANGDGIGDTSYITEGLFGIKDNYPLMKSSENYVPEWRRGIIPGDILYCPTIGGKVNHVGIYVGDGKVVEVCFPTGVAETSIEEWDYPEKNDVTLLQVDCSNEVREKAISFAKAQVGDDFEPAWLLWKKNPDPNSDYWYCSELVWAAYYNYGVDIEYTPDPWTVTPLEIYMDEDTFIIGSHKEGCTTGGVAIMGKCPVNLTVTDPDNLTISVDVNVVPGALYMIDDFDEDGSPDDLICIFERKIGNYLITVVPESGAEPTDTYTLEVSADDTTIILAEDAQISDIPDQPYIIESTDTGIIDKTPQSYVVSSDATGKEKNLFDLNENVYCYAGNLPANTEVKIYVVDNKDDWSFGDSLTDVSDGEETVTTNSSGGIWPPENIWSSSLTAGKYDIVVDIDKDGFLDPGEPIDNWTTTGFEPIPEFTTIAIPVAIVLGLVFLISRRKRKG